ncbi:MAG: helix-turn-helix domain-containing protein [Planctomycetota bacterium]
MQADALRRLSRHGLDSVEAGQPSGGAPMDKTKANSIDSSSNGNGVEPLLLRPGEAAKLLAISPRKLWELTNMGEVPVIRIGRSLRYPREALRAWVSNRQGGRS